MEAVDQLNRVHLRGLENIKCGDALNTVLSRKTEKNSINCIFLVLLMVKYSFIQRTAIGRREGKKRVAFLLSNSYNKRRDYHDTFGKITSTCLDKIVFKSCMKLSVRYSFLIFQTIQWYKEVRKIFDRNKAMYIISELYIDYLDTKRIVDFVIREKCKMLAVFSDFHPIDSLAVQLCKQHGIKTATLQHGFFSQGSVAFKYSHSDYFLGYGRYTRELAGLSGFDISKFVSVGMGQMIDIEAQKQVTHQKTGSFIVILDSVAEEDIDLLDLTREFAIKMGYKRIIKLHPGHGFLEQYSGHVFPEDEVVVKEKTIAELADEADFAVIAGGSTVFTEYLVRLFPAFLFSKFNDRYKGFKWCEFANTEELISLAEKNQKSELDPFITQSQEYVSEVNDVRRNYKQFFDMVCEQSSVG